MSFKNFKSISKKLRIMCVELAYKSSSSHIGSSLSIIDILTVLYFEVLNIKPNNPKYKNRDKFILSKGHACLAQYTVLYKAGFFDKKMLDTFGQNNSTLMTHINSEVPGVEFSTGSLGHGLPFATGIAYINKILKKKIKIFVLISDGELNEGSNWEAIQFASHHKLSNLNILIDQNNEQSLGPTNKIINLEKLIDKFRCYNLDVCETDGHSYTKILKSLNRTSHNKSKVTIFKTIKGKGVSFMENKTLWHYKSPTYHEYSLALKEIM